MLLQRTIDAYAKRKPLVLVRLLVDEDLGRCLLTLHGCSKPHLVIEYGRPRSEQQRVPTCREYLDRTCFRLPSLAARLLIYGTDIQRVILRVGSEGPTEIHYELTGGVRTRGCTVCTTPFGGESHAGPAMRLRVLAGGDEIFSRTLARAEERFEIAPDFDGRQRLVLCLYDQGGGWENDAIVLCDPEFR